MKSTNYCYKIAPSILSGDFAKLADECEMLIRGGADWLHVDVMDGHFVPNLTIGPPVVKSLRRHFSNVFFDCHLMVTDPDKWIDDFAKAGASQITFHYEASANPLATIQKIKNNGMKAAIAIKPETLIDEIIPLLDQLDMVLVMTVEPGFGGQAFMPNCLEKVRKIRLVNQNIDVQVDGGISLDNLRKVVNAGANVIVAGTLIFAAPSPAEMIQNMKKIIKEEEEERGKKDTCGNSNCN